LVFFFFAPLGLNFAELFERPFELAREAMLMAAEVGESPDLIADGSGHGESGLDFRVGGVDVFGLFVDAESEKIGFESGDAVDAPGCIGEGLDELLFERTFRLKVVKEAAGVALVGGVILRRQDDDVAGETMAESVEAGTLFAGRGAGAGGVPGVGAIDFGAMGIGFSAWIGFGSGAVRDNCGVGHLFVLSAIEVTRGCGGGMRSWREVVGMKGLKFGFEELLAGSGKFSGQGVAAGRDRFRDVARVGHVADLDGVSRE